MTTCKKSVTPLRKRDSYIQVATGEKSHPPKHVHFAGFIEQIVRPYLELWRSILQNNSLQRNYLSLDSPINTVLFILYGYITNSQYDQLPVGLIAQLVEHNTGITEVMGSNPVQA